MKVDSFTRSMHVQQALNEARSAAVFENVASEGLEQRYRVVAGGVECLPGLGESGIRLADEAVGPEGQLCVVGEFPLVVIAGLVPSEYRSLTPSSKAFQSAPCSCANSRRTARSIRSGENSLPNGRSLRGM